MNDQPVNELHWLTASEAARAFAAKTLSPVELMTALLQRIDRLDHRVHAFIRLDGDAAMTMARNAEAEIHAGRSRGPLHGVPVGIKDMIDVAGLPTTGHSKILVDNIAATDAVVVGKLRQAGAIVMGKLSTHEFAIGGPSFDLPFPPARNPWNTDHHPGGSSSGSGAGLGLRLSHVSGENWPGVESSSLAWRVALVGRCVNGVDSALWLGNIPRSGAGIFREWRGAFPEKIRARAKFALAGRRPFRRDAMPVIAA